MGTWWQDRVVYQIYPRSFQDSNGDGMGDLPGIISRLHTLKALGVGIIWLSPVYRSPDADNGYDISDYYDVDPRYGTLADMTRLFAKAAELDIKIIMDLVINHTSDEHVWFQKSRNQDPHYRDYYIWRKGKPTGGPPNNWTGFFMGDVWEYDEKSGEYYLHLFHKKQPDLNYRNPKVIGEIKNIMRFWLDKGAAGFRCDVINIIYKTSFDDGKHRVAIRGLEHYKSREDTHRILKELRQTVLSHYDCFTVGESVMVDLADAQMLCGVDRGELDMVFYFDHLEVDRRVARYIPKKFDARKLLAVLTKWQQGLDWNAVYLENHDQPRIVSHYGDEGAYRERSAKMLATMQFTLRGTPFIYQGQEIGMTNFDFTHIAQLNDVESHNIDALLKNFHIPAFLRWRWIKASSRDNARTPMQWTAQPGAGFTTATARPWLPINRNHTYINYEEQANRSDSVWHYVKAIIALRASNETLAYGAFEPLYADRHMMAYARARGAERYVVLLNFSKKTKPAPYSGTVVLSNTGRTTLAGGLQPFEAFVLKETSKEKASSAETPRVETPNGEIPNGEIPKGETPGREVPR